MMLYPFLLSISQAQESNAKIQNGPTFDEMKEQIDLIVDHSKSRLPLRLADENGVAYFELENRNNVIQHVMILYEKESIDIDLDELEQIQTSSERIKKNLCAGMTNSSYKYSDIFSKYEIRNRLLFLDKEGVLVYAANEFSCLN